MPVISQNTSYKGTSAKPKANIPATLARHQPITRALLRGGTVLFAGCSAIFVSLLFHIGWRGEGVVRRRRGHCPLKPFCTFPRLGWCFNTASGALNNNQKEQQLGRAEHEG